MNGIEQHGHMEFSKSILQGVEIKQCRNNPHAYKSHIHNELSLGYIVEGSTELSLSDKVIHYSSGDGVIIPPLMTHICAPKDINHWAYVMLYVDPVYYSDVVRFHHAEKLTGNQVRKLTGFIQQLLTESHLDTLENILIELLLEFEEKGVSDTAANISDAVKTIYAYILNHVNEDIPLEKLEQISGLNKFSIIRNFKKQYVTTPAAYHLQYRVAQAKKLLSKGAGVLDICEELGFYDQAHFIREFKKMYGVTPGTYLGQLNR